EANKSWFDHGLLLAARAFPTRREEVFDYLARWHESRGWPQRPSASGRMAGDQSLWNTAMRIRQTGDEALLGFAQSLMHAQALTVQTSSSATGSGAGWRGMGPMSEWQVGAEVRDWLAILALGSVDSAVSDIERAYPVAYTHRGVREKDSEWWEPNRLYVVKDADEELALYFDTIWSNLGLESREVRIRTYPPTGPATEKRDCVLPRQSTFLANPPQGSCAGAGQSFVHRIAGDFTDVGGLFAVEVEVEQAESSYTGMPFAVRAQRISVSENRALELSGYEGAFLEIESHPRLQASNHMTLAFRVKPTETTSLQSVVAKRNEYQAYILNGEIWVRFYLDGAPVGAGIEVVSARKPLPAPGVFVDVVATLAVDEQSGDAKVQLCVAGDCELVGSDGVVGDVVTSLPVGFVARQLPHPLTIGRHPVHDRDYLAGQLDDVWTAHRTALPEEVGSISPVGYSSPEWVADADRLGSGELFTFDDELGAVSGVSYPILAGVAGHDYTYENLSIPSRVARSAPLVRASPPRLESGSPCLPSSPSGVCRITYSSLGYAGALHVRSDAVSAVLTVDDLAARFDRFNVVDANGGAVSSVATAMGPLDRAPTLTFPAPAAAEPYAVFLG
ncbi:MAG: LamG-like jellyroll fold domain-containing protein, partial [Myxococcota bacterium]